MNDARLLRSAEVALVACLRAWAREGEFPLSREDIADRVGLASGKQINSDVIDFMIARSWIMPSATGFQISALGRDYAHTLLEKKCD